jgi:hypothetical protein
MGVTVRQSVASIRRGEQEQDLGLQRVGILNSSTKTW